MVKKWYADFTDTNDVEHSGHTNLAVVTENTKKLLQLALADRKLKLREIAKKKWKISEGSVFTILHEYLSMRKLCSKWVLHLLTVKQKQQWVKNSEHCLQLFQCNKKEFLCKYVTMDETWIHHFTPESNRQSAECSAAGESHPNWPKTQTSAGKFLASVFWDVQGILFIDYLEKGRIINSDHYIVLLVRLKEEITNKWPQMKEKSALSPRQCTKSQVNLNNDKTTRIALLIASAPPLFSRSGPQQLLAVCRSQKNATGKEIWLLQRSDIITWGVFWGQREIFQVKRQQIVREALESVYHPKRRLCWWIKSNFAKSFCFIS